MPSKRADGLDEDFPVILGVQVVFDHATAVMERRGGLPCSAKVKEETLADRKSVV